MRAFKFLMTIIAFVVMLFNGCLIEAAPYSAGLTAFRNFLEMPSDRSKDNTFNGRLIFNSPFLHAELVNRGAEFTKEKTERSKGVFDVNFMFEGKTLNMQFPFYIVESENSTEFYFQMADEWKKLAMSGLSVDERRVDDIVNCVKTANILIDAVGQQTLQVAFNGEKLFDLIEKSNAENNQKRTESDKAASMVLRDALMNANDITFLFTIDKRTGRAMMITADLSDVMQSLVTVAVNSAATSSKETVPADMMSTIKNAIPLSKLYLYVLYDTPDKVDAKEYQLPREVRKAEDITKSLEQNAADKRRH